jgi:hypothetical protein
MKSIIIKDRVNGQVLFHIKELKNKKYSIKVLKMLNDKVDFFIRDENNRKVNLVSKRS